ncbi:5412_t:CDS:1, partial [Cetraspora pellucida]
MYHLVYQFDILKKTFLAGIVLLLESKKFSKLDNSLTNIIINMIEVAILQFNALANNK